MRQKRWDLQIEETLHSVEFEHGRFIKKNRQLLIDGELAIPQNWRVYTGKAVVSEYPFLWHDHILTVVIKKHKRAVLFDLLKDGCSIETGVVPDFRALSQPKSTREKVKEALFWLGLILLWRISLVFL